jgi:hypothetical protein
MQVELLKKKNIQMISLLGAILSYREPSPTYSVLLTVEKIKYTKKNMPLTTTTSY